MFTRKNFIIASISFLTLSCLAIAAEAGWLIDHERFHVSVHGRLSCQECHSDIGEKSRHPDPVDVNRSLTDFFQTDQCAACHEEVLDEISEAIGDLLGWNERQRKDEVAMALSEAQDGR